MKDYYHILDVGRDATPADIKKAFRRLALLHHPDRNLNNRERAEEKFKEINEAFQVLGDRDRRFQYDYITAVDRYTRSRTGQDASGDISRQDLNEEALRQLLQQMAARGFGIFSGLGIGKGCGGFGRRCRRW